MKSSGGPSPPVSITPTLRPSMSSRRVIAGQSMLIQELSSPSAYMESGPGRNTPLRALPNASW